MNRIKKALELLETIPDPHLIPQTDLYGIGEIVESARIELRAAVLEADQDDTTWYEVDAAFEAISQELDRVGLFLSAERIADIAREVVIYQQELQSVIQDALQEAKDSVNIINLDNLRRKEMDE